MSYAEAVGGYQVVTTLAESRGRRTTKATVPGGVGLVVLKQVREEPGRHMPGELQRLRRDVIAATHIDDPRLASYRGAELEPGGLTVIRDWVAGASVLNDPRFRVGASLRQRRCAASDVEVFELGMGVLEALAVLHGRGLLARHVSPGNIHILANGTVVLSDWHARWLDPGPRTNYAPELTDGVFADTRSDLYALGALLFELVVGLPPRGPIGGQLERVEASLRKLLHLLLVREPVARVSSARAALMEFSRRAPTLPRSGVDRRAPWMLGCEGVLGDLAAAVKRLSLGRSELVFIRGGEGFGKSRLLDEVARIAVLSDVRVARCADNDPSGLPLGGYTPCFDRIADDMEGWTSQERREAFQGDGRLLLEISTRFHQLNELSALPEPARIGAEAARHRLFRVAARVLSVSSRRKPLLLLLDDLGLADPLSLEFTRHLARNVIRPVSGRTPAALLIIATYDPSIQGGRGAISSMVSALRIKGAARELTLKAFAPHEVRKVLSEALAPVVPPVPFVARVLDETSGIPLHVEELLRWLDEEGVFGSDPERWLADWDRARMALNPAQLCSTDDEDAMSLLLGSSGVVVTPGTPETPVGLSLRGGRVEATRIAEVVALAGASLSLDVLCTASGLDLPAFEEGLSQLLRDGVLQEQQPERFRFRHDAIAGACLAGVDNAGKRAIHGRIGTAVEQSVGRLDERASLWLAHHFHQGGDVERSLVYLPLAARLLKERHATQEALAMTKRFFRHLLALEPSERERHLGKRIQALQFLAEILAQLERRPEAIQAYREMGSLAEHENRERDLIVAWSGLALLSFEVGDYESSEDFARRVVELARRREQPSAVADNLAVIGDTAMRRGRENEALWNLCSALKIYREQSDSLGAARTLEHMGDVYLSRYKYQRARSPYRQACDEYRALDDKLGIACSLDRLGAVELVLGNTTRSLAYHRESLRLQREADHPEGIGRTLDLLGDAYRVRGDLVKARGAFQEALVLKREQADVAGSADTLLHVAHVALQGGFLDEAQGLLEQALTVSRRAGNVRAEAGVLVRLAQTALRRHDRGRAAELGYDGLSRARTNSDLVMECRAQIVLAQCQEDRPRLEAAEEAVRLAAKLGLKGLRMRAHATLGDVLKGSGRDDEAFAEYCQALDHASALMVAGRGGSTSSFLRRSDVLASLAGARELVSLRCGDASVRYPVLAEATERELVSA